MPFTTGPAGHLVQLLHLDVDGGGGGIDSELGLNGHVGGPVGVNTGGQQLLAEGGDGSDVAGPGVGHLLGHLHLQ